VIKLCAIDLRVSTVENIVRAIKKTSGVHPVPSAVCPLDIGLVTSIASEPSGDLKERAIRDCVLVEISSIRLKDLPLQATTTGSSLSARPLRVED
jgi:hypothetical protein